MPKVQADYSKTVIYKICCKDPSIIDIYVGHTTHLINRKYNHKTNCCNSALPNYNVFVYQFIRDHGGWDNWDVIPIEEVSCKNKIEALIKERYWIETLKATLNCNNSFATKEEKDKQKQDWYENNKEQILQKKKENYEENKEEILEKVKIYSEQNKEKIVEYQKEYREINKEKLSEQKKIYRETHKEEAAKANKEWKEKNKDYIKEKNSQIINCECGNQFTFINKCRHLQSKVHIEYQNQLCGIIKPVLSEEEKQKLEEEKLIKMKEQQKIYRDTHSEQIKSYKKENYVKNKEAILEQQRQYKELHKEELIEKNKKYIEENKEKIQETKNKWYEMNKEKILQKQKEMITCECGAQIRKSGRAEHLRSKKHKDFMDTSNTTDNIDFS